MRWPLCQHSLYKVQKFPKVQQTAKANLKQLSSFQLQVSLKCTIAMEDPEVLINAFTIGTDCIHNKQENRRQVNWANASFFFCCCFPSHKSQTGCLKEWRARLHVGTEVKGFTMLQLPQWAQTFTEKKKLLLISAGLCSMVPKAMHQHPLPIHPPLWLGG